MTKHEELLEAARVAIEALFSDRSVSVAEAIEAMEEIEALAETNIAALRCDLEKAGG